MVQAQCKDDMKKNLDISVRRSLDESASVAAATAAVCGESVAKAATALISSLKAGGTAYFCGNGGSASQAQHISAEFVGRFKRERRGLAAIAITTDTSILTAIGNDYGYEKVFSRQVESLGRPGDVLIALSTSGNSMNVIKAVEVALAQGLTVACFTGRKGGKLAAMVPLTFRAPSDDTSHIQEAHITALHALCDVVESTFSS